MLWNLFWFVVSYLVSDLLTPKPDVEDAEGATSDDFVFPTSSEARPIPLIVGDVWSESPNVMWWGDFSTEAVTEKACSGTVFKKCTKYTVAYKYSIGVHLGICHGPIDAITAIKFGDDVAWEGAEIDSTIVISEPNLFGGDKEGGGIEGNIDLISGNFLNPQNTYLASKVDPDYPAFRGLAQIVLNNVYIGTSSVPPTISTRQKYIPTTLTSDYSEVGGQANPAHILYLVITDQTYGGGAPRSIFDLTSWYAAASTLFDEGFGLRLKWERQSKIDDLVERILDIIKAVIYVDRSSGLLVLKLLREDYDVATLLNLDDSNSDYSDFSRTAWNETVNEVRVAYEETTSTGGVDKTAIAQDLGNIQIQRGEVVSTTLQYTQIATPEVAGFVAATELSLLSFPLSRTTIKSNRIGYDLNVGSVILWSSEDLGIENMVMRIAGIKYGTIEKGGISIDVVQDVYSVSTAIFSVPSDSNWTSPENDPTDVTLSVESELPYMFGDIDFPEERKPWCFVAPPTSDAQSFSLAVKRPLNEYEIEGNEQLPFMKSGTATTVMSQTTDTLTVTTSSNIDIAPEGGQDTGTTMFVFDDELMSYLSATNNGDGTYTLTGIERGLLDTVPTPHTLASRMWFDVMQSGATSVVGYTDSSVDVSYLTATSLGTLDYASATPHSITFFDRAKRPYPVGNIKINGGTYDSTFASGEAVVTWAERNRITQVEYIYTQDEPTTAPEPGTTYTLNIYDRNGVLLRTETLLTGTSYTYTEANELADNGLTELEPKLTFIMQTVVNSYVSWQDQTITVNRTDTTPT